MRIHEKMRKALSILLCLCMLAQNCPVIAFAAEGDNLCDHHSVHTTECGYMEGSEGSDCTHDHSEICYEILEGEETGKLICSHAEENQHDDVCGYAEKAAGQDCQYDCAECGDEDNGTGNPSPTDTNPTDAEGEDTDPTDAEGEDNAPTNVEGEDTDPTIVGDGSPVPPAEPIELQKTVTGTVALDASGFDNDEAFCAYAQRLLYGTDSIAMFARLAGDRLTGSSKTLYTLMKAEIAKVAAGSMASTVFTFNPTDLGMTISWTEAELGVSVFSTNENGETVLTAQAQAAVEAKVNAQIDLNAVLDALLSDCPYELYWFDKTVNPACSYGINASDDGTGAVVSIADFMVTLYVASGHQGGSNTTVSSAKSTAAATAAATAQSVVSQNSSKSDYEKLIAYKDYICGAVSYNSDAADESKNTPYGDPWQLIYVFDNDSSTNVVCEGYAKAFQYLCDLGGLDCISVTGTMTGGTGAGGHMWNVVTLGGENYLVDVTNCDEGTIGAPDQLFLAGNAAGSAAGYSFTIAGQTIAYTYDAETTSLWSESERTLAAENYAVPETPAIYTVTIAENIENGVVTANPTSAEAGATVTLTVTPDEGYEVDTVSYNDGADHTIAPEEDVYSFTMPAGNVTVTATFKAEETTPVCTCEAKCAEGSVNRECVVCGTDLAACIGGSVAKVGDAYYDSFATAVANWTDGTTLTLLANVTDLAEQIELSGNGLVLDLNGKSMETSIDYALTVTGGKLTIRDNVGTGSFTATADTDIVLLVDDEDAVVDFESGTLGSVYVRWGTFNMTGGKIYSEWIGIGYFSTGTVNVSGGEVMSTQRDGIHNLYGTLTVTGTAKITSENGYAISNSDASILTTISGDVVLSGSKGAFDLDKEIVLNTQPTGDTKWDVNIDTSEYTGIENGVFAIPGDGVTLAPAKFTSLMDGYDVKLNAKGQLTLCNHSAATTAVSNGNGTHNTTCDCNETTFEFNIACSGGVATANHLAVCAYCGGTYGELDANVNYDIIASAMTAAELKDAVAAWLADGNTDISILLAAYADEEMFTAVKTALAESTAADGSINLTLAGVKTIPDEALSDYPISIGGNKLKTLTLTDAETTGENEPFARCTYLESVSLPNATTIGERAFNECFNLTSVYCPKVTVIGKYAFWKCAKLATFDFTNITTIGNSAFRECGFNTIVLPETTSIGGSAFADNPDLVSFSAPKATSFGWYPWGAENIESSKLETLELTAAGNFTIGNQFFDYTPTEQINLVLNIDKKNQVTQNDDGTAAWRYTYTYSYDSSTSTDTATKTFKSITLTCVDGTTNHTYTYTDQENGTHKAECTVEGCGFYKYEAHTGTATYTVKADDSTKHDVTYDCCSATVTEAHTFTQNAAGAWVCVCEEQAVARVGDTCYLTLSEAITAVSTAAAADNAVVTLLSSITLNSPQTISSGVFTLDLNGKTLSADVDSVLDVTGTANTTIKGGTIQGPWGIRIYGEDAKATIDGTKLEGKYGVVVFDKGTADFKAGEIATTLYGVTVSEDGTVNISGGTSNKVVAEEGCILNITGGRVCGSTHSVDVTSAHVTIGGEAYIEGIYLAMDVISEVGSTLIVNGGTITGSYGVNSSGNCSITINGGTITGDDYGVYVSDSLTITGGTISGGTADLRAQSEDAKITLTLADGKTEGATFPGGLAVKLDHQTLQTILGDGLAYWQGNKMIVPAEGQAEIPGGDVTIKAECGHENGIASYTPNADNQYVHDVAWSCCGAVVTENCHEDIYTVSSDGATCTVTCDLCRRNVNTCTIVAPECRTYGDDKSCEATLLQDGEPVGDHKPFTYYQQVNGQWSKLDAAPTNAGIYRAEFVAYDDTYYDDGDVIIYVEYTIAKADVGITAPTPNPLTYTGEAHNLIRQGETEDGTMVYSLTENGEYTITIPQGTNAGDYTVWYYVQGDENHNDSEKDSLSVNIKRATLSVQSVTATGRVYDGTDTVKVTNVVLQYKKGSDDVNVDVTGLTGTLSGSNVGTYTTVKLPALTLTGTHKDNYSLLQPDGGLEFVRTDVTISKAPLTVTADNKTMTTGKDLPTFTYTITGFVGGETEDVLTTKPTAKTATDGKTAGSYDITVDGAEAANYSFSYVKGTLSVVDHQHVWTYTASGDTITATCEGTTGECPDKTVIIKLKAPANLTYDGAEKTVTVTQSPADFFELPAVQYTGDRRSAGDYTASLSYGGATAVVNFAIGKAPLSVLSAAVSSKAYDGTTHAVVTEVTFAGMVPDEVFAMNTDFTATAAFADANAGMDKTVTVTVTLKDTAAAKNYQLSSGTVTAGADITPKGIPDPTIILSFDTVTYNGEEHKPTVTVKDGDTLIPGDAYTVTYTDNVNAGTANVRITAKDGSNYAVAGNKDFTIEKADAKVISAPAAITGLVYTGTPQELIRVSDIKVEGGELMLSQGGSIYSKAIPTGVDADTYTVWYQVAGDRNHKDSQAEKLTVTIGKKELTAALSGSVTKDYDGTNAVPVNNSLSILLSGVIAPDTVSASASFAYGGVNVGTTRVSATGISLAGADAANYQLKDTTASADVGTITKADVTHTAPKAVTGLTYNGQNQTLITAGTATGGTLQYRLSQNESFRTTLPTGKNADTYTVYYKVVGDSNHKDTAEASVEVTIAKAQAEQKQIPDQTHFHAYSTANTLDLSQYLPKDRGETKYTLGTVTENTFAQGMTVSTAGTLAYTTNALTAPVQATITVQAVMENYGDMTLTVAVKLIAVTAQTTSRIDQSGLTQVPAGLAGTQFNTVPLIKAQQERVLLKAMGKTPDGTAHYDVKLQFSPDGVNWVDATEENFPSNGITVTLPYPAGTGRYSHDFVVSHMFTVTSARLGTSAGDVETPAVTKTANGIQVTLKGLSPVSLAWYAIDFDVKVVSGAHGSVSTDVSKAGYGEAVTVTVSPNSGYRMQTLTVKDAAGNQVILGAVNDDQYRFTMPASHVTVTATFSAKSTAVADPTNPKTGDGFNLVLWNAAAMTSLLTLAVLIHSKRRISRR